MWVEAPAKIVVERLSPATRGDYLAFFDHEQINWTWQLAELFKIENGMIRRVEAVFHRAPYGIPSGWSTFEQAMSEAIQSVR